LLSKLLQWVFLALNVINNAVNWFVSESANVHPPGQTWPTPKNTVSPISNPKKYDDHP